MRHRKAGIKLNRTSSHRQAMFRNMVTSLFKYDSLKTTDAKAKELRRWADHMITLAKRGDLHARRQALSIIREKKVVHKLFETANERWGVRSGGYTRLIKLGRRPGDAAPMSLVQLVLDEGTLPAKKKTQKKPEPVKEPQTQETAKSSGVTADSSTEESAVPDKGIETKPEAVEADDETIAEVADTSESGDDQKKGTETSEQLAAAEDAVDQQDGSSPEEAESKSEEEDKSKM